MSAEAQLSDEFTKNYPDRPARLKVKIDSALLQRQRLVELAGALSPHLVEFNPGDLPVSIRPDEVPGAAQSAAETIERIGECRSWLALRNVEHDPAYKALAAEALAALEPTIEKATGAIVQRETFIFISSAEAVTPFHFDEEHNILMQVDGAKTVSIFRAEDREIASQSELERFHSGGHRNLAFDPAFEARAMKVRLEPGDALYVPPLAPHYVTVEDEGPSLSLSVTWRSARTRRNIYLHQINHALRKKGGHPRFPGEAPIIDQLKIWRESAKRRLGL